MIYTLNKRVLALGLILSGLILVGCSTKSVEQEPIQPMPIVEETQTPTTEVETPPTVDIQTSTETESQSYSLQDIQNHNTRTDCWTTINGKVYNITTAFGKHPGGDDKLSSLCGIQGTAKFNAQHGTNDKSKARLNTLQIGTLK